ncbi:MAG: hypothetical protein HUK40_04355 [Desulfobacter sp.]|nr:hypothetical protein [Desulfobacter sp.]
MNKPFKRVGFLGVVVIGMSLFLGTVFPDKAPWMMDGFSTPILAFEFVQSKDEVIRLFGLSNSESQPSGAQSNRSSMILAMDSGNGLDYIYMVLYASFLFFFSLVCRKITGQALYYAASLMAVVILFADAFENIQLLSITSKMSRLDFAKELTFLHWFTWIKWGGISLVF